jgi:hypothetical protein
VLIEHIEQLEQPIRRDGSRESQIRIAYQVGVIPTTNHGIELGTEPRDIGPKALLWRRKSDPAAASLLKCREGGKTGGVGGTRIQQEDVLRKNSLLEKALHKRGQGGMNIANQ